MDELTAIELARLADYFAGELSPAEEAAMERWLHQRPQRLDMIADLNKSRIDFSVSMDQDRDTNCIERGEAVRKRLAALRAGEKETSPATEYRPSSSISLQKSVGSGIFGSYSKVMYRVAAMMVAAALVVISGWYFSERDILELEDVPVSTYTTANGERARITLPDGSIAELNVSSSIMLPMNYGSGSRTLYLSGEAMFTVSHKDNAPFTVIAGPSETRVLGTQFLVRYYDTDSVATVAVRDGKVSVLSAILTADEQVYVSGAGVSAVKPAEISQFGFVSGALVIDDLPLLDAIPDLNRWYDVDIRLGDDQLLERKVFGHFRAGSQTDLADYLEKMFDVRIVRDGRTLTLYPRV